MTTDGARLSAVARRRLRDAKSASTTPPVAVSGSSSEKGLTPPASTSGRTTPKRKAEELADDGPRIENQFTPLVDVAAVNFSSTREVEQVGEASVRIRLSKSQKCFVLGIGDLWVKDGSLSVYGATVHASTRTYRIYSPITHALVSIEALTKTCEFELNSVHDTLLDLPELGSRNLWAPPDVEPSRASFHILGHSFSHDPRNPGRFKELNIDPWKSTLLQLSEFRSTAKSLPRVLLCGKRNSGLSTFTRCLVNRIITTQSAKGEKNQAPGVTVVDLDSRAPEFAAPGMISLVHVSETILGPPFTHPLPARGSGSRILKQHFVGEVEPSEMIQWHMKQVTNLLDLEHLHRNEAGESPLIVIAPKWWQDIDPDVAARLWTQMSPTAVVCFDSSPQSTYLHPWIALASSTATTAVFISPQPLEGLSALREHNLRMQSYFHAVELPNQTLTWNSRPVLCGGQAEVALSYAGRNAQIRAVVLQGGHVAVEDTYDALEGSLAAVMAVNVTDGDRDLDGAPSDGKAIVNDDLAARQGRYLPEIVRTEEDIPRATSEQVNGYAAAAETRCLGLGFITRIDLFRDQIVMSAGLWTGVLESQMQGQQVVVVVPKATPDGRYKTEWMKREMSFASRTLGEATVVEDSQGE
ncbi:hypothetical protein PV10_00199 [Exophiala mesophila]|uniref:Polynucleotide 5'-hydroxyl-kinase GRC3 n=1 Tax=Exophiala mesophila TaxID=212818 RepID=A0A0D1ZNU9_EXOME|nr:uncharacterized protein PV10_00199 [Exophiala mesophila]KIV96317.1 hypothetical protein PV10_00199 [Exophiala mesophila]